MQFEQQQAFINYLQPNESIQWTGKPPGGLLLRKADIFMIPFSLLWGGFAIFWELTVFTSGAPAFFLLFGGVFVLVGLYIIVGRFFFDMLKRKNTIYALTNERALILSGLFGQSLKSLNLKSIPEISIKVKPDGRGTIIFGSNGGIQAMFSNSSWLGSGQSALPSFELIENANRVYQIIQNVQRQ